MIPYFISVLDLIGEKVVKSANTDLEKEIDNLVINSLAKDIKIPEQIKDNVTVEESRTFVKNQISDFEIDRETIL